MSSPCDTWRLILPVKWCWRSTSFILQYKLKKVVKNCYRNHFTAGPRTRYTKLSVTTREIYTHTTVSWHRADDPLEDQLAQARQLVTNTSKVVRPDGHTEANGIVTLGTCLPTDDCFCLLLVNMGSNQQKSRVWGEWTLAKLHSLATRELNTTVYDSSQ